MHAKSSTVVNSRAQAEAWRMPLQPLLQHHQDPHHLAVVPRMRRQVGLDEFVDEFRPHDAALALVPLALGFGAAGLALAAAAAWAVRNRLA